MNQPDFKYNAGKQKKRTKNKEYIQKRRVLEWWKRNYQWDWFKLQFGYKKNQGFEIVDTWRIVRIQIQKQVKK